MMKSDYIVSCMAAGKTSHRCLDVLAWKWSVSTKSKFLFKQKIFFFLQ